MKWFSVEWFLKYFGKCKRTDRFDEPEYYKCKTCQYDALSEFCDIYHLKVGRKECDDYMEDYMSFN